MAGGFPGIRDLTDAPEPIRVWARSVQEVLGLLAGNLAQTDDALLRSAVTWADLIEQGFAVRAPEGADRLVVPGTDVGAHSLIPPPAPTGFTVTRLPFNARLAWTAPIYGNHAHTEIWRSDANNLTLATLVDRVPAGITLYEDGYLAGQAWFYWIRHVSTALVPGAFNAIGGTSDNAQPGDVTGLSVVVEPTGILLRWVAVMDPDLAGYEIRLGASWATGALLDEVRATVYRWPMQLAGTYRLWVRARDVTGFYSGSASGIDVTISAPSLGALAFVLAGENVLLSWTATAGSFLIADHEIRHGATWAGATPITRALSTSHLERVQWAGTRRFWVAPRDVAGNLGSQIAVDIVILAPTAVQTLTAEVIDNNVLLRWTTPTATLPIRGYEVRKGPDFSAAVVMGDVGGNFATVFEQAAGDYTYWVRPRDSAGTFGPAQAVTARVHQPPDYVLYSDQNINLGTVTLSNAVRDGTDIVLPFNTTETWDTHYTSRGWTRDDDAISAGFPVYAQPAPASGVIEFQIDYGVAVPSTTVSVTPTLLVIAGTPTHAIQISHRLNIGDGWTNAPPGASVFLSTSFRYLRVSITAMTSGAGVGLYRCTQINVRAAVKVRTDAGAGTANAGDSGGTLVTFGVPFIDVIGPPVVQPGGDGTVSLTAVVNFVDTPNPTNFRVFIFNSVTGARVTAPFSWTARGIF